MSKKEENFQRDNAEETKKGMKEINKIIFRENEVVPDDWTDFQLTPEEVKILKEGENYIDKELAPSLSIYRKVSKEELNDHERSDKETKKREQEVEKEEIQVEDKKFTEAEIAEIDSLLKEKTKNLKLKTEKYDKNKQRKLKYEEEKEKKDLERLK